MPCAHELDLAVCSSTSGPENGVHKGGKPRLSTHNFFCIPLGNHTAGSTASARGFQSCGPLTYLQRSPTSCINSSSRSVFCYAQTALNIHRQTDQGRGTVDSDRPFTLGATMCSSVAGHLARSHGCDAVCEGRYDGINRQDGTDRYDGWAGRLLTKSR